MQHYPLTAGEARRASMCRPRRRCGHAWSSHVAAATPQGSHGTQQVSAEALLGDVRVVLVAPKTAANVGAAARCCANFEVSELWVVAPRCDPRSDDAYRVACGPTVLDRLVVVEDLAEALADTTGSIGFTRRAGATRLTHASISHLLSHLPDAIPSTTLIPTHPPPTSLQGGNHPSLEGSPAHKQHPQQHQQPQQQPKQQPQQQQQLPAAPLSPAGVSCGTTAVVFGREESGLTEGELRLCSHACAIPTGRVQASMNLSHAVAVVLCEVYQRRLAYQELLSLDPALQPLALSGTLADTHPAAPALAALPWLLPLAPPQTPATRDTTSTGNTPAPPSPPAGVGTGVGVGVEVGVGVGPATSPVVGLGPAITTTTATARSSSGAQAGDESLRVATTSELERLQDKLAAIARAVGISGEESRGGGNAGSHGRRRLPLGHLRALLSRARPLQGEVRSLHGLASSVLAALSSRGSEGPVSGRGESEAAQGPEAK